MARLPSTWLQLPRLRPCPLLDGVAGPARCSCSCSLPSSFLQASSSAASVCSFCVAVQYYYTKSTHTRAAAAVFSNTFLLFRATSNDSLQNFAYSRELGLGREGGREGERLPRRTVAPQKPVHMYTYTHTYRRRCAPQVFLRVGGTTLPHVCNTT